jgi:hypothetical protein
LVVTMPGTNAAQREEARVEMERVYRGPAQAGRSMILGGPEQMQVKPWVIGEKEVAYLESQKDARDAIAACFGVPTSMLTMENAALATAEAAIPHWRAVSLVPRSRRIEDKFNETVVEQFRIALGDPSLFVYFDTEQKDDPDKVSARVREELKAGMRSLNEARGAVGLDAVDGGDDVMPPEPEPEPEPEQAGADDAAADDNDTDAVKVLVVHERAVVKSASDMVYDAGACCDGHKRATPDPFADPKGTLTLERRLIEWFNSLEPVILAAIVDGAPMAEALAAFHASTKLAAVLKPEIAKMFTAGYTAGGAEVGASLGAFAVDAPEASAFLDSYVFKLSSNVTANFADRLHATVQRGIEQGLSIDQMTREMTEYLGEHATAAAETVARTESRRAYENGKIDAWERSGVVESKRWLLGPEPCEFCRVVAEKFSTAPLRGEFVPFNTILMGADGGLMHIDYVPIVAPPLHPNCVCATAPVLKPLKEKV